MSSNTVIVIEAGAVVLGSTRGSDWPLVVAREVWPQMGHGSDCSPGTEACRMMHQSLLFSWSSENVTMTGGGVFDCNAQANTWWSCARDLSAPPCNGYGRPHCVMFANVTGVEVAGVHIRNSPDWTLHFSSCTAVSIPIVGVEILIIISLLSLRSAVAWHFGHMGCCSYSLLWSGF